MIPEIKGDIFIEEKMMKITNSLLYLIQRGGIKTLEQTENHCGYCRIPM